MKWGTNNVLFSERHSFTHISSLQRTPNLLPTPQFDKVHLHHHRLLQHKVLTFDAFAIVIALKAPLLKHKIRMATACLSGPLPGFPRVVIPTNDDPSRQRNFSHSSNERSEGEPVSPLSYRSNETFLQEPVSPLSHRSNETFPQIGQPAREVSPKTSPARQLHFPARPTHQHHSSSDTYAVPPPKPVGRSPLGNYEIGVGDSSVTRDPLPHNIDHAGTPNSEPRAKGLSVQPQIFETLLARGQQEHFVAPAILQDHADHIFPACASQESTAPAKSSQWPRSQTFSQVPPHQAIPHERRICAQCGQPQQGNPERFLQCNKCVNMYYCPDGRCWAERVCHNRSREQVQMAPQRIRATQRKLRPQPRWEEQSRSQAPLSKVQRDAGTTAPAGSRCDQNALIAGSPAQNSSLKRGGRSRTFWSVLATAVCVILIIIVIAVAAKH